ncbi:MAG: hypothetical protein KIT48_12125 [Pseudolabrys sp.]|nr:hypothetical protein [Pseudolabrys sp.]
MYLVTAKPGNFGAHDILACKSCHGEMMLTRRSPHPQLGSDFEEQRFTCRQCGHEATRSVDAQGKPSPEAA